MISLLRNGKLFNALRGFFGGTQSKVVEPKVPETLTERRGAHIRKLESIAETEEAENRELEERLEFKKREAAVLEKIQKARSRRQRLWERLGEYGTRRLNWKLLLIIGGVLVFLVLLFKVC